MSLPQVSSLFAIKKSKTDERVPKTKTLRFYTIQTSHPKCLEKERFDKKRAVCIPGYFTNIKTSSFSHQLMYSHTHFVRHTVFMFPSHSDGTGLYF